MPFQSEKQRRYLHANHPEIAKRWEEEYATGGISNHFRKKFASGTWHPGVGRDKKGYQKSHPSHGGGNGGDGPPSIVHAPKGPTAAEIAAAKAKAEAEKRALEAAARKKHLTNFKKTQKKKLKLKNKWDIPEWDTDTISMTLEDFKPTKTLDDYYNQLDETDKPLSDWEQKHMEELEQKNQIEAIDEIKEKEGISNEKLMYPPPGNLAELTDMQKKMLEGPQKNLKEIMGISNEEILKNIEKFNNPDNPATIEDVNIFYGAKGGIANHFKFKNGGYAVQGGVKNYLGEQKMVNAPKHWQSAPHHPKTELTYITKPEKDLLVKADLHGSLHGSVNRGPQGLASLNGWGDAEDGFGDSGNTSSSNQGSDQGHSRFEPGSGYYGETVTTSAPKDDGPDPHGGDWTPGWLDDATRKGELKDMTKNWEDEWGKWDDPKQKYSFTKAGVDKRKNITTQQYLDRKTELEAKIRNNLLITLGSAFFLGTPVGLKDLVGIDWKDKKFSGVLADAMSLSQLEKEYLADLEGYKQNYADLGIPEFHHAVDTPIQTINQEILDITQKPDKEEIKDDGGPTPLVVPKVMEAFADATGEIDMFDAWSNIKQKQALRAGLFADEDQAKVGEWVGDQRLLVNSGGLANLFRVKNQ